MRLSLAGRVVGGAMNGGDIYGSVQHVADAPTDFSKKRRHPALPGREPAGVYVHIHAHGPAVTSLMSTTPTDHLVCIVVRLCEQQAAVSTALCA